MKGRAANMPMPERQTNPANDPAEWVDRHGEALYRFALLHLHDPALAEDVVQECFLAALQARERFAGRSSERTWLIGILKRKVIDCIRTKARRRTEELAGEEMIEASFDGRGLWKGKFHRWRLDPHGTAENQAFWDVFRQCLQNLPETLADAFLLRELDEMDSAEICNVLDITPTNLWTRLHRARLGLRQCLESNWFRPDTGRR